MTPLMTILAAGAALVVFAPQALAHPAGENVSAEASMADTPGNHGMFMLGSETLFLAHMPMFTNEKHMYQVVLRASLPDDVMAKYRELRNANPDTPFNLVNVDNEPFTLPQLKSGQVTRFLATIYDSYSNAGGGTPGAVLADNVPVTVEEVVVFRHFNFGIERPAELIYTLFGRGNEAHLTHYIARDPDFQHLITLPAPPAWLSAAQLEAGVELDFVGELSQPVSCTPPIGAKSYEVQFQGRTDAVQTLALGDAVSVWYSTGNLLNAEDPCAE